MHQGKYIGTWFVLVLAFIAADIGAVRASDDWKAKWTVPPEPVTKQRRNSWFCFRKTFEVASVPDSFSTKIACDSKYWLWVNGEIVVREGGLKRGPTPTGNYFDRVDLAPFLKPGNNEIAILVWHFGKHGFSHNDSGQVGLIVDGQHEDLSLRSDATWHVIRHPAFEDANQPPPNYRLPEGNIRFDARKDVKDWHIRDDFEQWPAAVENTVAGGKPWGELIERPIPQWKDYGVTDFKETIETTAGQVHGLLPRQREDADLRVLVGKLPYNAHVHPHIELTAPAGLKIDIQTDLVAAGGDKFLRAEYITRDGKQSFELPAWLNGHEVRYLLPEGVEVQSVSYRETGYDAEFIGTFRCDNERLNKLWEKSRRTLYVTMRDTYMDCPERERAQWWGDAVNELGEAFYIFDAVNGPLLARKGILELASYQRADDTLYSPVPSGVPANDQRKDLRGGLWNTELPRQMLASVGFYGFWNYYRGTGDQETIQTVYPAVRRYLGVWELDERGLVKHRSGEWDWTDWGQHMDVAVLENAWFHLALRGAYEMATLLDKPSDAAEYKRLMGRIEAAFNTTFWQGEYYRSPQHSGETDDRANALAVVAGLAKSGYHDHITKFLKSNRHASPYMEKYVLESLYMMRAPDAAIDRMLLRYESMIDAPETTLWETFPRPGKEEAGTGTYNHAWSGGPLTMMHQYVAGIEPLAPGFERFGVKPQLGRLNEIETVVPTRFGNIILSIKQVRNDADISLSMELTVPSGTTAEVIVFGQTKIVDAGEHKLMFQASDAKSETETR